uniref:HTH CENPB-type domain-containing protein n=1 Tax=Meloidogyne javanica TaxID=6303 RepID=A0A915MSV7_MELJA
MDSSGSEIDVVGECSSNVAIECCTRKRKSYSIDKKLEIIGYAKTHSNTTASKHYNIDRTCIIRWRGQESELIESQKGRKRLAGAGRHLTDADFDEQLSLWVRQCRAEKFRVSRRMIQKEAERIFSSADDESHEFKASAGWLDKFMKRHKFCLRQPTTICQKQPKEYESVLVNFIMYISKIMEENKYDHIYAADETAVWLDLVGRNCISEKGAKDVTVKNLGYEKLRVTVMLTNCDCLEK